MAHGCPSMKEIADQVRDDTLGETNHNNRITKNPKL